MFKFGQKEVTPKDFYGQRQITDIFTIPLLIKTPKNIFCYGVSQYDKISAYTMSFNVFEESEQVFQCHKNWNEVESQLFEKLAAEPIKGEGKYVHGKLKMWKERIRTRFHGQDVPYDKYCNATAVLKIYFVYKQGKNYYHQIYVEECKYTDAEYRQCNMLSDDDDGFFKV